MKRIFILEFSYGEDVLKEKERELRETLKIEGIEAEIVTRAGQSSPLTGDFDIYWIHISGLYNEEQLLEIKEETPWARLYVEANAISMRELVRYPDCSNLEKTRTLSERFHSKRVESKHMINSIIEEIRKEARG